MSISAAIGSCGIDSPSIDAGASIDIWASAGLGALQGVAEFLPISSSGHLALAQAWLGINAESGGHTLSVVLHAGTLLAVLVHYRSELLRMVRGLVQEDEQGQARQMALAIVVGTLPLACALIPAVRDAIVHVEGDVKLVGLALLLTALALAFSHRKSPPHDEVDSPPRLDHAFLIGCAQLLAITPGISRSGSTIAAALALGFGRARAAQFSFLLSIPAICGASLDEFRHFGEVSVDADVLGVGFVVSFIVGLTSLGALLRVIARLGMMPFVPYLLAVGAIAIAAGST